MSEPDQAISHLGQDLRSVLEDPESAGSNIGALRMTYTVLGLLIKTIVYWAPKPYSNY